MGVQELMIGDVFTPGVSLSSKQLQRMVTALDLVSDKTAEIGELEAELLQAKSKALLYEVYISTIVGIRRQLAVRDHN